MSYLVNDPAEFRDEMIGGLVAAHEQFLCQTRGGVVRASETPKGQVAIVIGGGSGHFPAFSGLVGQGLAHGAAMGNVFASPSADEIYAVARAAASDAGVFMSYGNYAGDVLHFTEALERLNAEGIPCRQLPVTDDVCSAGDDERQRRRGIAGMFAVFRAAAYAAEQGKSLDEVWEAANAANESIRTMGVAFSGCTLPGKDKPLFTLPPGKMGVGMGIHGEPGIEIADMPTANGLADLLVERLHAERPSFAGDAPRVAVIVNGLGAVKYEELFLLYAAVAKRLNDLGYTIVEPEVGELVTSFEMAGVSVSLVWLDEALERAWTSPALAPAYKKGAVSNNGAKRSTAFVAEDEGALRLAETRKAQDDAKRVVEIFAAIQTVIDKNVDHLGQMDTIAGDGDHGIGMQRGASAAFAAAQKAQSAGADASSILEAAGKAWAERGGGTSGALWGLALRGVGAVIAREDELSASVIAEAVAHGAAEVVRVGKAQLGDKTMVDAMIPFSDALSAEVASGQSLAQAWARAATLATMRAEATESLMPQMGRARPHAAKSLGTPDPGAISFAMIANAVGDVLMRQDQV